MFAKVFTALVAASAVLAAPVESQLEKRIQHDGQATYFEVGLGACGWWNVNEDYIVALNSAQYQRNGGSNCGQGITLTNSANGKKIVVTVADECPTCDDGSLDLSPPPSPLLPTVTWTKVSSLSPGTSTDDNKLVAYHP